jgi:hypothetical protein
MNTPELPFKSDAFLESWKEWGQFRKEIKKPLTPTTIKKQLKLLESLGEQQAIASINASICSSWQGLFPVSKTFKATVHIHHEEGGGF